MFKFRLIMVALVGRQFILVNQWIHCCDLPKHPWALPFRTLSLRQCYLLYSDTEGSFMVQRALQIAEACIEDMREYDGFLRKENRSYQFEMQPNDFLSNIFYFRVCSYTEQIAVVNYLEKFISEHDDVG